MIMMVEASVVIGPNQGIRSVVTSPVDVAMRSFTLLLAFLVPFSFCFYVPGLSPVEYGAGDAISVKVA